MRFFFNDQEANIGGWKAGTVQHFVVEAGQLMEGSDVRANGVMLAHSAMRLKCSLQVLDSVVLCRSRLASTKMTKHSKNNTASSVFSYAEYKKLDYGTKKVRLLSLIM